MITWQEEININTNIEIIWDLFKLKNIQTIMPNVLESNIIEGEEGLAGTKYIQKYKEGSKTQSYIVEVLEYENIPEKKHTKITFTLAKMFKIQCNFTLVKLDENNTKFIYKGQNAGLGFIGKLFMKLPVMDKGNKTIVTSFMQRVNAEALKHKI